MSLLCEHSAPFLATWPTSGMTRTGSASELPMWERPTPASGSSSSPGPDLLMTPKAEDGDHPGIVTIKPGQQVHLSAQVGNLLPTPKTTDAVHSSPADADRHDPGLRAMHALLPTPDAHGDRGGGTHPDGRRAGGHSVSLQDVTEGELTMIPGPTLLPTPSVADGLGGHLSRSGERGEEMLLPGIAKAVAEGDLLPTLRATDGTKGGPGQRGSSGDLMLPSAVLSAAMTSSPTTDEQPAPDAPADTVLLPTPTAKDAAMSGGSSPSDVTLTDALVRGKPPAGRWSPGDPTNPPSDDGNEDWDE